MIGDRSHDMIGAKNNGMQRIGVLYGYGSREELLEAGAQHICLSPADDYGLHALNNARARYRSPGIRSGAVNPF